uniref:hypothetical protein n=1 Tax=Salmonella sp. SAL4445 TaxID=3159900 RepID=UPI00397BA25E
LPYLIVSSVLRKTRTVPVPLCDRHANHWKLRSILTWGGLAAVFVFYVMGNLLIQEGNRDAGLWRGLVCLGSLLGLVVW